MLGRGIAELDWKWFLGIERSNTTSIVDKVQPLESAYVKMLVPTFIGCIP